MLLLLFIFFVIKFVFLLKISFFKSRFGIKIDFFLFYILLFNLIIWVKKYLYEMIYKLDNLCNVVMWKIVFNFICYLIFWCSIFY